MVVVLSWWICTVLGLVQMVVMFGEYDGERTCEDAVGIFISLPW